MYKPCDYLEEGKLYKIRLKGCKKPFEVFIRELNDFPKPLSIDVIGYDCAHSTEDYGNFIFSCQYSEIEKVSKIPEDKMYGYLYDSCPQILKFFLHKVSIYRMGLDRIPREFRRNPFFSVKNHKDVPVSEEEFKSIQKQGLYGRYIQLSRRGRLNVFCINKYK